MKHPFPASFLSLFLKSSSERMGVGIGIHRSVGSGKQEIGKIDTHTHPLCAHQHIEHHIHSFFEEGHEFQLYVCFVFYNESSNLPLDLLILLVHSTINWKLLLALIGPTLCPLLCKSRREKWERRDQAFLASSQLLEI